MNMNLAQITVTPVSYGDGHSTSMLSLLSPGYYSFLGVTRNRVTVLGRSLIFKSSETPQAGFELMIFRLPRKQSVLDARALIIQSVRASI